MLETGEYLIPSGGTPLTPSDSHPNPHFQPRSPLYQSPPTLPAYQTALWGESTWPSRRCRRGSSSLSTAKKLRHGKRKNENLTARFSSPGAHHPEQNAIRERSHQGKGLSGRPGPLPNSAGPRAQ